MTKSGAFYKNLFRKAQYSPTNNIRLNLYYKIVYWSASKNKTWKDIPKEISHLEWEYTRKRYQTFKGWAVVVLGTLTTIKTSLYFRKLSTFKMEQRELKKFGEIDES